MNNRDDTLRGIGRDTVVRCQQPLAGWLVGALLAMPAAAELLPDGDHDCLYLERNAELRFADMPLAHELERTAWAYTAEYAHRFLMPEDNIEPLVGAVHSRYVVRQDVNLVCAVDGECWPMNHCQFELYVPREAAVTAGRQPDSYQDPMWGDRMARFLSPRDPEDVRHMNERRRRMRHAGMRYEIRRGGQWESLGEMQLIGYRKSISDELDALVVEGDCGWYRDSEAEAGRIVLEEEREGRPWRHEVELPGSYLKRVTEESAKRLWPSVDAYRWWWADTWWPEEGYGIGYDDRFSGEGARAQGRPFWIWDSHVWDYTEGFAERFGMPKREGMLTSVEGGLVGAYAMASLPACGVRRNMPVRGTYTVHHGYRDKYLRETPKNREWYCYGSLDHVYEFYLPYRELQAMGVDGMDLAEQLTWMPTDVLRGWRHGEKSIELCRHPDHYEWFIGRSLYKRGLVNQVRSYLMDDGQVHASTLGSGVKVGIDLREFPGVFAVMGDKWTLNIAARDVEQYLILSLTALPPYSGEDRRFGDWEERKRARWVAASRIDRKISDLRMASTLRRLGMDKEYLVMRVRDDYRDKYIANKPEWHRVLNRVEEIAAEARSVGSTY